MQGLSLFGSSGGGPVIATLTPFIIGRLAPSLHTDHLNASDYTSLEVGGPNRFLRMINVPASEGSRANRLRTQAIYKRSLQIHLLLYTVPFLQPEDSLQFQNTE